MRPRRLVSTISTVGAQKEPLDRVDETIYNLIQKVKNLPTREEMARPSSLVLIGSYELSERYTGTGERETPHQSGSIRKLHVEECPRCAGK